VVEGARLESVYAGDRIVGSNPILSAIHEINFMINKDNTVILVALKDELPISLLPGWNIQYTGVGKVNAAHKATRIVYKFKPENIINYGSAGSLNQKISGLQQVTKFIQRDMLAEKLGFKIGYTPYDKINIITTGSEGISCSTGDNFVDKKPKINSDLVDMEAYAIAKVCKKEGIQFYCFKFVSDKANEDANIDWKSNLSFGAKLFQSKLLNDLVK
jgi:adenosylhomocysteine nucleosidase